MKRKFLILVLCGLLAPVLSSAEDPTPTPTPNPKLLRERQRLIEVLSDRIHTKKPQFSLVGRLEANGKGVYSINGEQFSMDGKTNVQGELRVGSTVEVRGFYERGAPKIASQVVVIPNISADLVQCEAPDLANENQALHR